MLKALRAKFVSDFAPRYWYCIASEFVLDCEIGFGSLVVVGCAGCCHSDTSRCVGDGGVVVAEAFYFSASFCVYFDKASHFITLNCITELMIFMSVYAYMYVLYVIPQYHVSIVYINPITTFIVYIITFYSMFHAFDAIMFYCTLSEMTRIKMINQVITELTAR